MKTTGTAARSDPSCDGELRKAAIGCETGLRELKRREEKRQQIASLLMQPINGERETVDKQTTGDEVAENRCALLRAQRSQSRRLLYALIIACVAFGVCIGAGITAFLLT